MKGNLVVRTEDSTTTIRWLLGEREKKKKKLLKTKWLKVWNKNVLKWPFENLALTFKRRNSKAPFLKFLIFLWFFYSLLWNGKLGFCCCFEKKDFFSNSEENRAEGSGSNLGSICLPFNKIIHREQRHLWSSDALMIIISSYIRIFGRKMYYWFYETPDYLQSWHMSFFIPAPWATTNTNRLSSFRVFCPCDQS